MQLQGGPRSVLVDPFAHSGRQENPGVARGASPRLSLQLLIPPLSLLADSLSLKGDGQRV